MADLTSYRQQLAADLALEFPDADVLQGERTGKATDRAKVAVFVGDEGELGDSVVVGQAEMFVRYWPKSPKIRDDAPSGVRDPSELEAARVALQAFLQTKQKAYPATGVWFSRMTSISTDSDPEEWGVEARLILMFSNPAVLSG